MDVAGLQMLSDQNPIMIADPNIEDSFRRDLNWYYEEAVAAIESGVLLEDTYEALLGAAGVAPNSPNGHDADAEEQLVQQATSATEAAAAAAASDKDKKELEVVELLVPGVIDDLVDSSELDEEVRKFFF